jgi:hypothetical protein
LNSSEATSALAAYVNSVFNIGSTQIWIGDFAIRIFGPNFTCTVPTRSMWDDAIQLLGHRLGRLSQAKSDLRTRDRSAGLPRCYSNDD